MAKRLSATGNQENSFVVIAIQSVVIFSFNDILNSIALPKCLVVTWLSRGYCKVIVVRKIFMFSLLLWLDAW